MAAPEIGAHTRHIAKGVAKCYFVETIASKAAPTRIELDAGTDLSPQIMEIDGWLTESESVDTPNLKETFTSTIPGSTSVDDSSLTMYHDREGDDIRALLARDDEGFIVWFYGGDVSGRKMSVFPVRVASLGVNATTDDDPVTIEVNFNVTSEPAEYLAVPA